MDSPADVAKAFDVSRETMDRLRVFVDLTRKWNPSINLIGKSTVKTIWKRHIADSLQLMSHAPAQVGQWTDIGSGAGFPGLVAAIVLKKINPSCQVTLIDSDKRKCLFLRTVARELDLNIEVISERLQDTGVLHSNVLSARALAPLDQLLALSEPFLTANTVCLFPKGLDVINELTQAAEQWTMQVEQIPSVTDPNGVILKLKEVSRV